MKKGYTHIAFLIDRSGSMSSLKDSLIKGFNNYLKEQQESEGKCTMTLVQFDYSPFSEENIVSWQTPQPINIPWGKGPTSPLAPIYSSGTTAGINPGITWTPFQPTGNLWVSYTDGYQIICDFADIKEVTPLNSSTYIPRGSTAYLDALGKLIDDTGKYLSKLPESERPEKVIVGVFTDGYENASVAFSKAQIAEKIKHQTNVYNWQFTFLGANMDAVTEGNSLGIGIANSITYTSSPTGVENGWAVLSCNTSNYRSGAAASMAYSVSQRELLNEK